MSKCDDLFLNDRGFAFDAVEGQSYQLSSTALRLVRWMQEVDENERRLLELLLDEYDVEEHAARRDLHGVLTGTTEPGWR